SLVSEDPCSSPFSSWLSPSQTPQSARREDEREAPEPAERPECPDEKEAAGGLGDLAVVGPPHVHDGHGCREQPDEQHDDVPRSPFGEHERHHAARSEEHTSELQSLRHLVCRLLLEKKKKNKT